LAAAAFVAPSLLAFTLFVTLPTLVAFGLAFFEWDLFGSPRWVGVDNFSRLMGDVEAWQSLLITVAYLLLAGVPAVLLSFCAAALLDKVSRSFTLLRVAYFVPLVVSTAVSGVIWRAIYAPQGFLNGILAAVGIGGRNWTLDPATALPALALMMTWLSSPVMIMLYLAAMQRIPDHLHEAAALDGAGLVARLRHITWPSVLPTTLVVCGLAVLTFVAGGLEVPLIMTGGGPLDSTRSLALYAYQVVFVRGEAGYGSALASLQLALFLLPAVFVLGVRRMRRRSS
jgi:multiple sugar transport system permease protein